MNLVGKCFYEQVPNGVSTTVTRSTRIIAEYTGTTGTRMYKLRIMTPGYGATIYQPASIIEKKYNHASISKA